MDSEPESFDFQTGLEFNKVASRAFAAAISGSVQGLATL